MYKVIKTYVEFEENLVAYYGIGKDEKIIISEISDNREMVELLVNEINKENLKLNDVIALVEDFLD